MFICGSITSEETLKICWCYDLFNLQAQAQKRLQYVELDHQQVRKKGEIRDKAAVLYSELKINEPPEVNVWRDRSTDK